MAKKIRFPLEMEDGAKVRSVEELREHFSTVNVLTYVHNGKLVTWLRDRYADDLADAVEQLDVEDAELPRKVSEIFDVPYHEEDAENLQADMERSQRLEMLRAYTNEERFITHIDDMAFDQDGLYDLLDEGKNEIYLCGDKFSIPLAKKGVTYIGVNNPIAVIDSKEVVDWKEKEICLKSVRYDERYQTIVDEAKRKINEYRLLIKNVGNRYRAEYNAELVDKDGNVKVKVIEGALDIEEYDNKIYSLGGCSETAKILESYKESVSSGKTNDIEIPVFIYDTLTMQNNIFSKRIEAHSIVCVSDKWLVCEKSGINANYCHAFAICNLESGEVKYHEFIIRLISGLPHCVGSIIIKNNLFLAYSGELKLGDDTVLHKLNLETLEETYGIQNGVKGSLMSDGESLMCLYGQNNNKISFCKIRCDNDELIQFFEISFSFNIGTIPYRASLYSGGNIYFVACKKWSNDEANICCLNIDSQSLSVIKEINFFYGEELGGNWKLEIIDEKLHYIGIYYFERTEGIINLG